MAKVSNQGAITDSTDDSLLMISYSTDNGATYQTKKIRIEDLFDDIELDDISDVDVTTQAPVDGEALVWNETDSQWEPGPAGGGQILTTARVITEDFVGAAGENLLSINDVEVADGYSVTVADGSTWIVID